LKSVADKISVGVLVDHEMGSMIWMCNKYGLSVRYDMAFSIPHFMVGETRDLF